MKTLPLPGLVGSEPLGALAAFGLLRICDSLPGLGRAALAWDFCPDPVAVLRTDRRITPDGLVEAWVLPWMRERWRSVVFGTGTPGGEDAPGGEGDAEPENPDLPKGERNRAKALRWDHDIKVAPETFAGEMTRARSASAARSRHDADFLAGYGTDAVEVKTSSRGLVGATTDLCMVAGNQAFLKLLRELAFTLDPTAEWGRRLDKKDNKRAIVPPAEAFRLALFAPWDYTRERRDRGFLSLGWDPSAYYVGALRGAGSQDVTPPRAAVWLAAEALPLFPCLPVRGGRARTRGFDRSGERFRWPVWADALGVEAARTALGLPALYADPIRPVLLRRLGLRRVYGSDVVRLTDYPAFGPAVMLAEAGG